MTAEKTISDSMAALTAAQAGFATPLEASDFLHVSIQTLHNLVKAGNVPAVRYGRCVRIPWAWLHRECEVALNSREVQA
jgi:excisionase family DNA binding protein